jgi:hypothetical protein
MFFVSCCAILLGFIVMQKTANRLAAIDFLQDGRALIALTRHKGIAAWIKRAACWPIKRMRDRPFNRWQQFFGMRMDSGNRF